jgi:hypothetical protein
MTRPRQCALCGQRAVTWCVYHHQAFCMRCSTKHENEAQRQEGQRKCFWTAPPPVQMRPSEQLQLDFQ